MSKAIVDLTGKVFGRWTVLNRNGNLGEGSAWDCVCDCGILRRVKAGNLVSGGSLSCGCHRKDACRKVGKEFGGKTDGSYKPRHGQASSKNVSTEYRTWSGMITRCYNRKADSYHRYGGRGIIVCKEWLDDFNVFYNDMGKKPKGLQLDRINNDGNYEHTNCRWVTPKENMANRACSKKR